MLGGGMAPPLLGADAVRTEETSGEEDDHCETDTRGVSVPVLNIDPRIERGIYVFSAIASTLLIRSLEQVAATSSMTVLLLLIILMFFFERMETEGKSLARRYAPKAFSSPIVTFLKIMEFMTTLSVYVVISYSIVLLSGLWIDGNLTFAETAVTILVAVAIAYTIAVAYHDVHNTLERAYQHQQQLKKKDKKQTGETPQPCAAHVDDAFSLLKGEAYSGSAV